MGSWCKTTISNDIEWEGAYKEKLEEEERMLRPKFLRPAYQGTELESKINGSFSEYIKERDK